MDLDLREVTDRIYDTLLHNKNWPQLEVNDITEQSVNSSEGIIEFEYLNNNKVTIKISTKLI